jgi:hydrogenase maturation protein HypF
MPVCRKRARISGIVQGVGFRPFLWRLAGRHGLAGWVENGPAGVVVEVQGERASIDAWLAAIRREAPPLAAVEAINVKDLQVVPDVQQGFVIHGAMEAAAAVACRPDGAMRAPLPPEIATCPACLSEVYDPANRRHRYPFTTCTDCGPRFTIIEDLPYDRLRTSMREYPLCDACGAEYHDPADRRFHAEAIACPACGPAVWFTTAADPGGIQPVRPATGLLCDAAITAARERLLAGDILAVKGLGGFHLVCDATNAEAVERLRCRKHRTGKPLAVMVADIAAARLLAEIDEQERRILESRERPIVLARRHASGSRVAQAVAPGNDFIGLMLPAWPLQHFLCFGMPPLVTTSGNRAEEPLAFDNIEAISRLGDLADGFLMHDRRIIAACDDSVVRCVVGTAMPIRRSRGFSPLPIRLGVAGPTVLAVGGELKAALCLVRGEEAVMSQHIGDMGSLETHDSLGRAAEHLMRLFQATPQAVACDLHPGYVSTAWARRFAEERGIPVIAIQHHEAHVAALLADHGSPARPLIGVCFDGTGYGHDGTIQGGEFLTVIDGHFRRAAHLDSFPLPGGDASIRHPWRTAIAMLHAGGIDRADSLPPCGQATAAARKLLEQQLSQGFSCVATSSMGRLFDAVASLAGVRHSISHEAEAAMALEAIAGIECDSREPYAFPIVPRIDGSPLRIDWRQAVAAIVRDVNEGVEAAEISTRFHHGIAEMIASVCRRLRGETDITAVGLTGGVFQNAVLVSLALDRLRVDGFDVLLHERVPPNDGGLALGQTVIARQVFARRDR